MCECHLTSCSLTHVALTLSALLSCNMHDEQQPTWIAESMDAKPSVLLPSGAKRRV